MMNIERNDGVRVFKNYVDTELVMIRLSHLMMLCDLEKVDDFEWLAYPKREKEEL
jgi:hypothetical protein